jgi:hypothetical protein
LREWKLRSAPGLHVERQLTNKCEIREKGEKKMELKKVTIGAFSAIALFVFAPASQAAPLSATTELKAGNAESGIEKAAYRRCWWRHGARVCRWVGYRSNYDDDNYGYYGYGPGIGFGFGGGGRGHFHGGHRR